MIVVIDTNVWISAMLQASRQGIPALALEITVAEHTLGMCDPLEAEITRILVKKFAWSDERVREALRPLLEFAVRAPVYGNLHVCRDPDDDMILECAVNAGASFIVSGDKDLLVLGSYRGIRILTPSQYLDEPA